MAQDPNYSGPAKMYVNNYFKDAVQAKKLIESKSYIGAQTKITYMEKSVATIKTKDPKYDTNSMETEIAELKVQLEAGEKNEEKRLEDNRAAQWSELDLRNTMDYLFKNANFQVGTFEDDIEEAKKTLAEYKEKTDFVLEKTQTPDPEYIRYIERAAYGLDQHIADWKNLLADISTTDHFQGAFYEMRLHQAHWDAAKRIYPSEKSFASCYDKITTYINEVGSMDKVAQIATDNDKDKIANRKMEAPVAKDATFEKSFTDLFNAKFQSKYGVVLKCVLLQENWTTERNQLTSVVTGRNRAAQIAYKGADGKCYLLSNVVYLYEEYVGGQFINRVLVYNGLGGSEMLCENVK